MHEATIESGIVRLEMLPVLSIQKVNTDYWLHTGSPHYVSLNADHSTENVVGIGKSIRYSKKRPS